MAEVTTFYPGIVGGVTARVEPDGSVTEVILPNSSFRQEHCQMVIDFFNVNHTQFRCKEVATVKGVLSITEERGSKLPTFAGFAASIGVSTSTLSAWEKKYPEFHAACDVARAFQEDMLIQNGLLGHYSPATTIFVQKNVLGWRDKIETEETKNVTHRFVVVPAKDPIGSAATTGPRIENLGPDSETA